MNQTHKIMRKPEINMKAHFVSRNKKKMNSLNLSNEKKGSKKRSIFVRF